MFLKGRLGKNWNNCDYYCKMGRKLCFHMLKKNRTILKKILIKLLKIYFKSLKHLESLIHTQEQRLVFQHSSLQNKYCNAEVNKGISIHNSEWEKKNIDSGNTLIPIKPKLLGYGNIKLLRDSQKYFWSGNATSYCQELCKNRISSHWKNATFHSGFTSYCVFL